MRLPKTAIKLAQSELKERGHYDGRIDGLKGPKTDRAAFDALMDNRARIPFEGWPDWSTDRKLTAFLQLAAHDRGIEAGPIDGLWGQLTQTAYDALIEEVRSGVLPRPWREEQVGIERPGLPNPNDWPVQTLSALRDFYGAACDTTSLTQVRCPWRLTIAWDKSQHTDVIACHEKVARSLERVLESVHKLYGDRDIRRLNLNLYGGSYNCRDMRGGLNPSTHSWGIAIDWDPEHNRLQWGRGQAHLARPEYEPWWDAWEQEGWRSLGREKNYDWMHVQAALLPN